MTSEVGKAGVVSVGRLYCDLIFTDVPRLPTMGTEVFAGGFGMHAGGGAAITAAHLAALGRPAALAAILPRLPFGPILCGELSEAGIDLSLCQGAQAGEDHQVTAALAGQGDRAFVTRRTGPAAPDLDAGDLARLGVRHMHVGELTTLIEMPGLIALARAAGLTVSLDCGWDDALTAAEAAPLVAEVDIFLPNAAEAERLSDLGMSAPFAPLTVVKRGAEGATANMAGRHFAAPAEPVTPLDTTGAGDAFNAGFIDAWLDGATIPDCLRAGNRCGARAIGLRGGFGAAARAGRDLMGREIAG